MFDWLKKKDASVAELRDQLHAAEHAHEEAVAAVSAAERAFDDDGSDRSAKALTKAKDDERIAAEHVARARRLLPRRVVDIADSAIEKMRGEQSRLRAQAANGVQSRLTAAESKVAEIESQLERAKSDASAIRGEMNGLETRAAKLDSDISQIAKHRDDAAGYDPTKSDELRRLVLIAEIVERRAGEMS